MITKLEITGRHIDIDPKLQKYVTKKIGQLDRFVSRHSRESLHAEVILQQSKVKDKNQYGCEVIMHLPQDTVTVKESTVNMFAAVDIVEARLRNQLKKYKETHGSVRLHRRLFARFARKQPLEIDQV